MALEDFATLDYARGERCGFPEVVFGEGKTAAQVCDIVLALLKNERDNPVVLVTRASKEHANMLSNYISDTKYVEKCGLLYVDRRPLPLAISKQTTTEILAETGGEGNILVCCAGTSDLKVAEEAAITARIMGSHTSLLADVGVAGVHRVLQHTDELRSARVIIAVAGMEGALPSLIAGLVDVPVVAVPTSVGYGANLGGIAALLAMLNSCAGGVSVVNIDNGFGAGVVAHRINIPPKRFNDTPRSK